VRRSIVKKSRISVIVATIGLVVGLLVSVKQ
jgi:uncharacterized protein YacL